VIFDGRKVPEDWDWGKDPPAEALMVIPTELAVVLLDEMAKTEIINRVLSGRTYTKDMADRHLDIIERLIEKLPGRKEE
jgi:hypothetical protein